MPQQWLDRSAAGLSALCVLHCLAGVILVALLVPASGWLAHEVHLVGFLVALPLALVALIRGHRAHRRSLALLLGGLGLASMAAGLFAAHGAGVEIVATGVGAALLGIAHVLNLRWSLRA